MMAARKGAIMGNSIIASSKVSSLPFGEARVTEKFN